MKGDSLSISDNVAWLDDPIRSLALVAVEGAGREVSCCKHSIHSFTSHCYTYSIRYISFILLTRSISSIHLISTTSIYVEALPNQYHVFALPERETDLGGKVGRIGTSKEDKGGSDLDRLSCSSNWGWMSATFLNGLKVVDVLVGPKPLSDSSPMVARINGVQTIMLASPCLTRRPSIDLLGPGQTTLDC